MMINTQICGFTTFLENKEEDLEVENEIEPINLQSANSFFSNGHSQLVMILGFTQSQNINAEITVDIGVVNGVLKLSKLVNQCPYHEVYTSQRMERRVVGSSTSTSSNRYNSFILYLFSNESTHPVFHKQNNFEFGYKNDANDDEITEIQNSNLTNAVILIDDVILNSIMKKT
ncbi:hypothetical protein F8M41_013157 [Gigaspora margarita]|uniref:Uncharacterized protein n=1 Tax=Gigaspora margarita TaxID=4874 RepID=A0A8H4EPA6_GIGMA|nr:hypothetical protein F8M41_013157 [Gigaspora margarita]